ncbi:MAG: Histidine kinase [Mucilaginibacter sp.]|nr:Histidine kinase [Mucilaginibacter sp.]
MDPQKLGIKPASYRAIVDCTVAFAIWLIVLLFLTIPDLAMSYRIFWGVVVLPFIPIYGYLYGRTIPRIKQKNKEFLNYQLSIAIRAILVLLVLFIAYYILLRYLGTYRPFQMGMFLLLALCFIGLLLIIVTPVTWLIYNYRLSNSTALDLKNALGHSSANLGFLRSQINPHFLFNALNTLYGTALQENADRTGEGIQKLGDMMRFMLQENMQDKIALSREIDYLNNYVDLQKLRVQTSPDIVIDVNIEDQHSYLLIAPMLLIPFVENAFKHGISLQEPSYIKISLHTEDNRLYFDISNSIHAKRESDPERDSHGIGLENVSQRLNLLYADNHELVIHESVKEFFVHLVINLTAEIAIIE